MSSSDSLLATLIVVSGPAVGCFSMSDMFANGEAGEKQLVMTRTKPRGGNTSTTTRPRPTRPPRAITAVFRDTKAV